MSKFGGKPGVLISEPDIYEMRITDNIDFIVLGCDGIFDTITNSEVCECIWLGLNEIKSDSIHTCSAAGCDLVIKTSLKNQSFDNVSSIVICFENFEKIYNKCNNNESQENYEKSSKELIQALNNSKTLCSENQNRSTFPSLAIANSIKEKQNSLHNFNNLHKQIDHDNPEDRHKQKLPNKSSVLGNLSQSIQIKKNLNIETANLDFSIEANLHSKSSKHSYKTPQSSVSNVNVKRTIVLTPNVKKNDHPERKYESINKYSLTEYQNKFL